MEVTKEMIERIIVDSKIICQTTLGRTTIVSLMMPNGFLITETSTASSEEMYDYQYGIKICIDKIKEKIWELEVYRVKCEEQRLSESANCEDVSAVEVIQDEE